MRGRAFIFPLAMALLTGVPSGGPMPHHRGAAVLVGYAWAQEGAPEPDDAQRDPAPSPPPDEARPAHPEPRIIVTVPRVRGPHDARAVERAARLAWGRIARCYKLADGGPKRPRGKVHARVEIRANGEVIDSRRQGGSLKGELARCLVRTMRRVTMPRARAGSTAEVVIQVAPGD